MTRWSRDALATAIGIVGIGLMWVAVKIAGRD